MTYEEKTFQWAASTTKYANDSDAAGKSIGYTFGFVALCVTTIVYALANIAAAIREGHPHG